jgi:hypothetical protein
VKEKRLEGMESELQLEVQQSRDEVCSSWGGGGVSIKEQFGSACSCLHFLQFAHCDVGLPAARWSRAPSVPSSARLLSSSVRTGSSASGAQYVCSARSLRGKETAKSRRIHEKQRDERA